MEFQSTDLENEELMSTAKNKFIGPNRHKLANQLGDLDRYDPQYLEKVTKLIAAHDSREQLIQNAYERVSTQFALTSPIGFSYGDTNDLLSEIKICIERWVVDNK